MYQLKKSQMYRARAESNNCRNGGEIRVWDAVVGIKKSDSRIKLNLARLYPTWLSYDCMQYCYTVTIAITAK